MKTFKAPYVTDPVLRAVVSQIEEAAGRADPYGELQYLNAEPKKLRAGMFAMADGVNWNPGSGEGLYRRDKTNASWVFIG